MLAPSPALADAPAPQYHDVTVVTKKTYACAKVEGVPPEEFGIARTAKNIQDSGYCFHEVTRQQADLIADGFDFAQIDKLPSYSPTENEEQRSRNTVGEDDSGGGDDGLNRANRNIKITEHYVRMDYEGNGKAGLYRVTTGGDDGVILKRDGVDDIVPVDMIPFAAMTPVIVTHRFFGRSVADLVMDIQRMKTALMRGMLDNLYLHNNPRVEVAESHAGDNTLDDLLVSRPGGIVRSKQPGGIQWQVVPDITPSLYPALQYLDATREWRTGVSRQGQGVDPNALQNQVATIANQMFNASQAKVKLIARIFAETGIRDLFSLLHATIRKNGSQAETVKLRNQWVTVNPREWKTRNDMTINVGLGTGSKEQQLAMMQLIIAAQKEAIGIGMATKGNFWNSAKELVKLAGRKDPESFFTAPPPEESEQPIPPPPDPKMAELEMKSKLDQQAQASKEKIEVLQAQADTAANDRKVQADMARDDRKFQQDSVQSEREHQMRMAEMQLKLVSQLASAAAKPKPGAMVDGEGGPVQTQEPGVDIQEIIAQLAPLMGQQQSKPRKRTIKTPKGQIYEMTEE